MADPLWNTLIGGLLALSGIAIANLFGFFSSKVERQHKHAASQRERLEKISDCVAECVEWSQTLLIAKSIPEIRDTHLPPGSRRMVMLAKIHFSDSELIQATTGYMNNLIRYKVLALNSFRRDAPSGATIGQMLYLEPERMKPIDDEQLSLRNKIDDAIAKEAIRYEPSALLTR